jgi:glycosyltransferase involved in cell wall biosynthesis
MTNVFIYTTPHPAHKALADSIGCIGFQSSRKGFARIPIIGRILASNKIINSLPYNTDLILTESISTDMLAGADYKKFFNPKCKLISLVTDPKILEFKKAPLFDKLLTYDSMKEVDLFLVGSQMMFDLMPKEFHDKTKIFHPGIQDIKIYLKCNAKHGKDLVFVGQLSQYKGIDLLVDFFIDLKSSIYNPKLYIAGNGLLNNLVKNRTNEGILWLGQTKNALFMHKIASFCVSRARFEPSGVAILEGMAQGLVPIVSEGVGYRDIVRQVDPRLVTTTETLNIISRLIHNKKEWVRLSKKSKKIASKYSYEYMIKEFKTILQDNNIF